MSKHYPVEQRERAVKMVLDPDTEGSESYVYTHLGTGDQTLNLVARAAGRAPARLADTVALHLAEGPVHLFHPVTGQRIT